MQAARTWPRGTPCWAGSRSAAAPQAQQAEFYTALYHALLHPNVISDANGQYMGFDGKVHTVASGPRRVRQLLRLGHLPGPGAAGRPGRPAADQRLDHRSMVDDYAQTGMLPKWSLDNGETYVMVGDPADAIIADYYAFGARDFDAPRRSRTWSPRPPRPTTSVPANCRRCRRRATCPPTARYGCCNFYGPVSTQLEYDTADFAIAALAGDRRHRGLHQVRHPGAELAERLQPGTGFMQAKLANGQWLPGFAPGTTAGFVEGTRRSTRRWCRSTSQALISGPGRQRGLDQLPEQPDLQPDQPGATNADLRNEPSLEIPWEYDYAGAPYKTQQTRPRGRRTRSVPTRPVGQAGNDDLGAMSAWYVWSALGMYPETPGTPTLALGSPVFPKTVVHLAAAATLTINAAGAQDAAPYVQGLTLNGAAWNNAYLDYRALRQGATLDYTWPPRRTRPGRAPQTRRRRLTRPVSRPR